MLHISATENSVIFTLLFLVKLLLAKLIYVTHFVTSHIMNLYIDRCKASLFGGTGTSEAEEAQLPINASILTIR